MAADSRPPAPTLLALADVDEVEHRHATSLELFFDLVFVVAVAQLSHKLVSDQSAEGFLRFVAVFVPVW